MGILDLPYLHMYWRGQWRQPYVINAFTRDRFKELLRYFHIAEPTPPSVKHDVVDMIKPLCDHCLTVFREHFTPPGMLTLDEIMVRFKGRSLYKTIIKIKLTPICYKLYAVVSHGYLLIFQLYRGKGGYSAQQGKIHHTVVQLVHRSAGTHRTLLTDKPVHFPCSRLSLTHHGPSGLRYLSTQPQRPPAWSEERHEDTG
jgi:hypothetical protein